MYIITLFIIFIIIVELYYVIKKSFNTSGVNNLSISDLNVTNFNENIYNKETEKESKFNTFFIKGDKKIEHNSGKIFIEKDFNIFIHYKSKTILMKKNIIYDIPDKFILEIIDVNEKSIFYYYFEY